MPSQQLALTVNAFRLERVTVPRDGLCNTFGRCSMRKEDLFELLFTTGLPIVLIGLVWLLVIAYRVSLRWGLITTLLYPAMILPHTIRHWPRTKPAALTILFGLLLMTAPAAYTRLVPVDLGEYDQIVSGERHLTLTGWNKTDYSAIAARPDTVVLQMANADVTDDTLKYLEPLASLKELDLSDTKVTDAGLQWLRKNPRLETLRLARTSVTDAGLSTLETLPALKQLDLTGAKVAPERLQKWMKENPERMAIW